MGPEAQESITGEGINNSPFWQSPGFGGDAAGGEERGVSQR